VPLLSRRPSQLLLAALLLCASAAALAADATLQKARAMLEGGSPQGAYDLLAPLQAERAGDPQYDYLLGVAALELGRNTEAVFALERVLAIQPNDAGARAQIARAYFNLKETDSAKREFETVREQNVSPEVKESINRYLTAIDQIAESERFSARFYLEFSLGYDSNVNGATDTNQFAVPSLPDIRFTLAPSARETPDGFFSAAAGVAIRNPLSKRWAVIGGASAYRRMNFNESDFNTSYIDGYLGLSAKAGRSTFTMLGQGNIFLVDDPVYSQAYRNALGGTLQWTHDFNARNQVTAYVQYAALTYPDQSPRDADRYIAGAGYAHAFRSHDASVYLGVYGGIEKERDEAFAYLGFQPIGLRLGGQTALNDRTYLFATAAAEWREYRDVDPFFLEEREDQQYSVTAGVHRLLANRWRMSPQVSWLQNKSNIVINEYDRWQAFVSLRRDW
jgi:tetratricopeptide (TPR) repeat protein